MQIGSVIGGFTLAQSDEMRKAMGKKKKDLMATFKIDFIKGAQLKGLPQERIDTCASADNEFLSMFNGQDYDNKIGEPIIQGFTRSYRSDLLLYKNNTNDRCSIRM